MEELSNLQHVVLKEYCNKKNIFITGPAGSGKSYLIQYIMNHAKENNLSIQCCAMTGCAAFILNCGAKTLHSWSGVGLMSKSDDEIIKHISNSVYLRKRWMNTDILIIDEVSMLSLKLFELLDKIGKVIRDEPNIPFGGLQVILSGDFHQLAPPAEDKYCFESPLWDINIPIQIELNVIFRQKEERFTKILNQIRRGRISRKSFETLMQYLNRDKSKLLNGIQPTILYPRKFQVDRLNKQKLMALHTEVKKFHYHINFKSNRETVSINREVEAILKHAPFEETLELKVGTQVMCVANLDVECGICNGSLGIITHFDSLSGFPVVKFNCGITRVIRYHTWTSQVIKDLTIQQLPLVMAWAITIHKAQGASLDLVEIDIGSSIFAYGQTYVALSRVKTLDGLFVRSFSPHKIIKNETVDTFYKKLKHKKKQRNINSF